MKIENLVKNLQKNTTEQDKIMQEEAQSVTERHLASYSAQLKSSRNETKQALAENIKIIKESRTALQQALAWKMMLGALMGILGVIFLILLALNLWLGLSLKSKKVELLEITQQIEQSPLEAQALAKVQVTQNPDKSIWIIAKNPKKSEAGNNTNGKPSMKLE